MCTINLECSIVKQKAVVVVTVSYKTYTSSCCPCKDKLIDSVDDPLPVILFILFVNKITGCEYKYERVLCLF